MSRLHSCSHRLACGVVGLTVTSVWCAVAVARDSDPGLDGTSVAASNAGLSLEPETDPAAFPVGDGEQLESTSPPVGRGREGGAAATESPAKTSPEAFAGENIAIRRTAQRTDGGPSATPWYRRGFVSLLAVLAVIAAVAWVARRFPASSSAASADVLRVLCRTHLSPKQSIALVRMGGRFAFVGVTPERITPLRVVEDAEEAAALRVQLRLERVTRPSASFDEALATESDHMTSPLEPAMTNTGGRRDRLARTRDDVNGLLQKLRSRSRELSGDTKT